MNNNGIVFYGLAFELVAMSVGGYVVGNLIDEHYHWQNFASTYLVLILMVSWFIHLIYLLRRFEAESDKNEKS